MPDRPNIVLIVSDQERQRDWVPKDLYDTLPGRRRLRETGVELARHYTHSSPCSPSRATLFSGQYVPEHGVTDNVFVDPVQPDLHTATPTLGHLLGAAGYYCGFVGKWHLSYGNPNMKEYGFADWRGEDWAWTGLAGTGNYYDPVITSQVTEWIAANAKRSEPWCLVASLVNPHDIAWYPADQPDYQEREPERTALANSYLPKPIPGNPAITPFTDEYGEYFALPANFDDDLGTKPAVQKTWQWEENHWHYGILEPHDERTWRRALDYYWELHRRSDEQIVRILDALDASGRADDTIVVFTSDHGEMCGGHGLRGKGPFAYEEIMRVPLYVRVPGMTTAGTRVEALSSSVDIVPTLLDLAGAPASELVSGVSLAPLLDGSAAHVRDAVLFTQEQGWHQSCVAQRFALRGYFDGRYKYVRYYGVGGGVDSIGRGIPWAESMRFGPDASFFDHEHELYDLHNDPGELENLANVRSRRSELAERFDQLLKLEAASFTHVRPAGPHLGSTGESGMMSFSGYELGDEVDFTTGTIHKPAQ